MGMTEYQNVIDLVIFSGVTGFIISGLSVLASKDEFNYRKYLYTFGLAGLSSLAIVQAVSEGITPDNVAGLFLQVVGASFLGNKLFGIGDRLKGLVNK